MFPSQAHDRPREWQASRQGSGGMPSLHQEVQGEVAPLGQGAEEVMADLLREMDGLSGEPGQGPMALGSRCRSSLA